VLLVTEDSLLTAGPACKQMFSTLAATKKVVAEADNQFDHFHAVMAKPTT
jgi:hypothetical protein